jgi:hypothetical protein
MSERPRKSNRAGTFRSEPPLEGVPRESINSSPFSSPRGSRSPIEPPTARDSEHAHQVVDQETKNLSQTIRELIRGVPAAPASSPIDRNPIAPEGRTGGFLPSFEDVMESKSSSGSEVPATTAELPHPAQDRSALCVQRETDSLATTDHGSSGEPLTTTPVVPAAAPMDALGHDLSGDPRADRPGALAEEKTGPTKTAGNLPHGSESTHALIGALTGSVDTSHDRNFTPASTGVGNDISQTPLSASGPLVVDSHIAPGDVGGVASRDASMEESGTGVLARGETSMERMTVPASGLLGRGEDPFESASSSSNSSASMGGQIGGDSFSSHDDVGAGPDDSRAGGDMTRTNTLLEQILDELRRHEQPSYVQSGRSVYPER